MANNDNLNNIEFNRPENKTGIIKWMWWLYVVAGLFIVCLLIWMFVALSKNQLDTQIEEKALESGQTSLIENTY